MRRLVGYSLILGFMLLAILFEWQLWPLYEWRLILQIDMVLLVSTLGENIVSSQGYYQYTKKTVNGPFARNVPLWIPFMWLAVIHASFLAALFTGIGEIAAGIISGFIASTLDFIIVEPLLSKALRLWEWKPVTKGYFHFIPRQLNRFTAPIGNYFTWLIFVTGSNLFLVGLHLLL